MQTAKQDALAAIAALPDDARMEDILVRLTVLDRQRAGAPGQKASAGTGSEGEFDERRFAEHRSHLDAQMVSEHARTVAQTIILVNGGAATAALAFAAGYDGLSAIQALWLALGVAAYAAGVGVGAYDLSTVTSASFWYMKAWEGRARGDAKHASAAFAEGQAFQRRGNWLFLTGFALFGIGSVLLAAALIFLPGSKQG